MSIPQYSEDALSARDVFFNAVASVHLFVEDERLENLYEVILSRAFPRLKSFKVFPLAGKQNVLRHATAAHSKPAHVTRVYFLDRNFDDLCGKIVVREDIFYLDHYCIESVVFDEQALLAVCVDERPRVRKADLRRRLDYAGTLSSWLPSLDRLHRAFALSQLHNLGLQNVDSPIEMFTAGNDRSVIAEAKVDAYVASVSRALVTAGVISSEEDYPELSRLVFGTKRVDLRRVSGKILGRLHYHRLKRDDLCGNLQQDSLLIRCARASRFTRLRGFSKRVRAYMRAQGVLV
ncbi:DUF4435 domain-containing protein [Lysobacter soli]|uniref:DUF4435 domain-containing protein n=1 Tax=Lysobacter soli TaxID=453783 RepID=UPI00368D1EDF